MSFAKKIEPLTGSASGLSSSPSFASVEAGATGMDAYIGKGAKINGNLTFTGPVEIDGQVEGEIHSKDRLIIGESAVINAKINGTDVLVKGTVNGDISATKRLSLKRPAKVTGNISSTTISIEEGVMFEGKCTMTASAGEK